MQRLIPAGKNVVPNILLRCSQSAQSQATARLSSASLAVLCRNSHQSNNVLLSRPNTQTHPSVFVAASTKIDKCFYASSADIPENMKIRLPALSPTMEAGTLAKWVKKEGDQIMEGDLIAEIETDKATMGLEASDEGYLAKILIPEKTKDIPLKTLLCIVVKDKEDIAKYANYVPSEAEKKGPVGAEKAAPTPAAAAPPAPKQEAPKPAATQPAPPPPPPAPAAAAQPGQRVFATPLARKLALERSIDISLVQGTGPDGEIRGNDVLNYTAKAPSKTVAPAVGQFEDLALNNFRQVTAKRLLQSKQTIPHYYLTVDFELDNALKVRKDLNDQLAKDNMKVSINDIVIKAAALACRKVPEANSAWMDTFIRKYNNVDINVAVATENGLITPIVFNADQKGLTSISFDVNSLAQKARANKLQPHEFQGGTFTISNLGMFGIKQFAAVINPPQSCILAVGGAEKRVIPDAKDGHRTATFMTVTLSCDHRVVDGAVGAKWLDHFKKFMENPASMLL